MKIIRFDLHAAADVGDAGYPHRRGRVDDSEERKDNVREFYSGLARPARVGIETTGSMQWFVNLMEELRATFHTLSVITFIVQVDFNQSQFAADKQFKRCRLKFGNSLEI